MSDVRIIIKDGALQIPIDEVREMLVGEARVELIKSLGMEKEVIAWVVDMLCGDVPDYYTGDDHDWIQKLLVRLEKKQLADLPGYYWSPWDDLRDALKWRYSQKHIYWLLWHDEQHGEFFRRWLRDNNIDSHHTTKLADEHIKQLHDMVTDALRKMEKKLPDPVPAA